MPHAKAKPLTTLLLGHTDGPAAAASRLGVLTTDTETPVVTETTVGPDLLQALEVITELGVDVVGENLRVLAIDDIALPVEEPLLPGLSVCSPTTRDAGTNIQPGSCRRWGSG
jgi:hypothetical protein